MVVFDTSSDILSGTKYNFVSNQKLIFKYDFTINLLKGTYTLACNIHGSQNNAPPGYIFYENNIFAFTVKDNISHQGVANLNAKFFIDLIE
jgi:hypothetical protein